MPAPTEFAISVQSDDPKKKEKPADKENAKPFIDAKEGEDLVCDGVRCIATH